LEPITGAPPAGFVWGWQSSWDDVAEKAAAEDAAAEKAAADKAAAEKVAIEKTAEEKAPKHLRDKREKGVQKQQKERNRTIAVGAHRFVNVPALSRRVEEILNSRSDGEELEPDGYRLQAFWMFSYNSTSETGGSCNSALLTILVGYIRNRSYGSAPMNGGIVSDFP
jgi:hypothetical protein